MKTLTTSVRKKAETTLDHYRDLRLQRDAIQKEMDSIKNNLITALFEEEDTYKSKGGIILATYKASQRIEFKTQDFKKSHEDLYNEFSQVKIIKTFLVK
jgi:hypothetical protein